MKTRKRGPGRPPKYVTFDGKTVVGLSFKNPEQRRSEGNTYSGRYYAPSPITGKRVYFGSGLAQAVKRFRSWRREVRRQLNAN